MSEPFKTKIEPISEPTTETEQVTEQPQTKAQDAPQQPTDAQEKGSVADYLKASEFLSDFNIKMNVSKIEKFIQGELEERGLENTKANYHVLLMEIENLTNLKDKDLFTKIKKLSEYGELMGKIRKLNLKKDELLG